MTVYAIAICAMSLICTYVLYWRLPRPADRLSG
ncbi:Uncharacterised protein [Mycobacteroides abscessus subsp. abscessus]|nr:Uncharacterised protein [Mycobacteroides abscessus subsp. abscessus]